VPLKIKLPTGEILQNEFNSEDELKKFCFQNNIVNFQVERKSSSFIKKPFYGYEKNVHIPVDKTPLIQPVFVNRILEYKPVKGLYRPKILYQKRGDENL